MPQVASNRGRSQQDGPTYFELRRIVVNLGSVTPRTPNYAKSFIIELDCLDLPRYCLKFHLGRHCPVNPGGRQSSGHLMTSIYLLERPIFEELESTKTFQYEHGINLFTHAEFIVGVDDPFFFVAHETFYSFIHGSV